MPRLANEGPSPHLEHTAQEERDRAEWMKRHNPEIFKPKKRVKRPASMQQPESS